MEYKKSSWREQRVTVKPNLAIPIYFNDTKPNHVLFANPSASQLFVSVSSAVSETTFDMIVPAYGTRLYPRELGLTEIYVYQNGTSTFTMTVTSWEGTFDPSSISQSQEIVSASASGLLGVVDVANILNPLPSGTNKIGIVDVASLPSISIESMPSVTIDNMPSVTVENFPTVDYSSIISAIQEVKTELQEVKTELQEVKTYPFQIKSFVLSTDERPTDVQTGHVLLEVDTKKVFIYDGTNWVEW